MKLSNILSVLARGCFFMKRFLRSFGGVLFTAVVLGCMVLLFLLCRAPAFEGGEGYTFYLGKSSSALTVHTDAPVRAKLLLGDVKGESTVYSGDRYEELKEKYRAKLLFTETVGGVTSYYLHSPFLGAGIKLGGKTVNLQIAVSAEQTAVGTPLIFGGF